MTTQLPPKDNATLAQIKQEFVSEYESGQGPQLALYLARYPQYRHELIDFAGVYLALNKAERLYPQPAEPSESARRARERALARLQPKLLLSPVTLPAAPSLGEARKRLALNLPDLASKLGVGMDVVQKLEQGRITTASIPAQFIHRLAVALQSTEAQVQSWLAELATPGKLALRPALLRAKKEMTPPLPQTFAEAIARSPQMTPEQKIAWQQAK